MSRLNNLYLFLNDEKGRTLPRAKLFFYENESFDFKPTYADKALTAINPNPVIADGAGRFPNIFLEPNTYRVVLQDEDGVEISTKDDVDNLISDGDDISNTTITTSTGPQTLAGALDDRVVRVGSVAGLDDVTPAEGLQFSVGEFWPGTGVGGGLVKWNATRSKTEHNGITVIDPGKLSELGAIGVFGTYFTAAGSGAGVFEAVGGFSSPYNAGALLSQSDNSIPLNAFFSISGLLYINDLFPSLGQVSVPYGAKILSSGGGIDFSGVTDVSGFSSGVCCYVGGGDLTALPSLSSNISEGDDTVSFSSAPALSPDDLFIVYNPTDFSYSGFRADYRAGEFFKVLSADASSIKISGASYAGYNSSDVDMYRVDGGRVHIAGNMTLLAPSIAGAVGCRMERVIDSDVTALNVVGGGVAALQLKQCYNISGTGLKLNHNYEPVSLSTQYGLSVANCQKINLSGDFYAWRHASTIGGFADVGSVVNRDITIQGTFTSALESTIHSVDCHGNSEHVTYRGVANQGIVFGGNHTKFDMTVFDTVDGLCVSGSEISGFDHDFSGCRFIARNDATAISRATIEVGSNDAGALNANTTSGGTLNLSGITVKAPNSNRAISIFNRGCTETDLDVDLSGAKILELSGAVSIRFDAVSGSNFRRLFMGGYYDSTGGAAGFSGFSDIDSILDLKRYGRESVSINSAVSSVTVAVAFGALIPRSLVDAKIQRTPVAGDDLFADVDDVTDTGFNLTVRTQDGSNFGGATDIDVYWSSVST